MDTYMQGVGYIYGLLEALGVNDTELHFEHDDNLIAGYGEGFDDMTLTMMQMGMS